MTNNQAESGPALTVDHVVDYYRRYPGEDLTFFTRVSVHQSVPGYVLRLTIPARLQIGDFQLPPVGDKLPVLEIDDDMRYVVWRVDEPLEAGASYEYRLPVTVDQEFETDQTLESDAIIFAEDGTEVERETVSVVIWTAGRYIKYLPGIYHKDELMKRFLMLFESMWAPLEEQIDNIPYYFDPKTAPLDMLPWLASWADLELDDRWPEKQKRELVRASSKLHKKRGTRAALKQYIETYTGVTPEITEHRARNFQLGPEAVLGAGVALGTDNMPHSFTVSLTVPAFEGDDPEEVERKEAERRRTIQGIIEAEKPAHTFYRLQLEVVSADQLEAVAEMED